MGTVLVLVYLLTLCGLSLGQECREELLKNVDFPGTDLQFLYSPDVEHCQQLCTQHHACLFFTFIRPDWTMDNRHFYCYLKATPSGQPNLQTSLSGVTSGFSLRNCQRTPDPCLDRVYHNVDFFGADYRTLFTADYEECQRVCTHEPGCSFFTFVNAEFSTKEIRFKCHLKYSSTLPSPPIVEAKTGVVSGFSHFIKISEPFDKTCEGRLFPGTDIPGKDLLNLPAASPEHCLALCSAHPSCTYFSFVSRLLTCYLKNNPNTLVTNTQNGITSGLPVHFCQLNESWVKVAHKEVDFRGSDIRFELVDDAEKCQTICNGDANCQFYAYVQENFFDAAYRRRCYLKRVITMPAPPKVSKLDNVVSGFSRKSCGLQTDPMRSDV